MKEPLNFHDDIDAAITVLKTGGIILYPTDTVWGIGCDACNKAAVAKVYSLKCRPDSKALITLVADFDELSSHVESVPREAMKFLEDESRPVTVVFDRGKDLAPNLLAEDGSVGLRITREDYSQALCKALGKPLVSTSANVSGQPSPSFFNEIAPEIIENVDYVARYGRDETTPRKPSMVVKVSDDGCVKILRS